jgi:hypothetical protein
MATAAGCALKAATELVGPTAPSRRQWSVRVATRSFTLATSAGVADDGWPHRVQCGDQKRAIARWSIGVAAAACSGGAWKSTNTHYRGAKLLPRSIRCPTRDAGRAPRGVLRRLRFECACRYRGNRLYDDERHRARLNVGNGQAQHQGDDDGAHRAWPNVTGGAGRGSATWSQVIGGASTVKSGLKISFLRRLEIGSAA